MNDFYRERRPPYSEDAEQAVIAAILMDSNALINVLDIVDASMFYAERHRKLFSAMVALCEVGSIVDPVTLSDRLASRGELESAGGKDYLGFLIDAVPTSENIAYHAEIVREKAYLRRVIEAATEMQSEAFAGHLSSRVIAQQGFESLLPISVNGSTARGFTLMKESIWPAVEAIEARAAGAIHGIRTGYRRIDEETAGILPGEFFVIGAVEGMGKSALALNLALRVASTDPKAGGGGVGYVSAEMTKQAIVKRALSWAGRIDGRKLRSGDLRDDDFPRLARAAGLLTSYPIYIDDEAEPTLADVSARCTHLKATQPDLRMIVVDFLQLVRLGGSESKRHEQLAEISYALKGLAKRLDIVVVAPCQVNSKDVEAGRDMRPQLKDLQGSSGMRQAADLICLMYRPAVYEPDADKSVLELQFAKCREAGPFLTTLRWDGPTLTIEDR